MKKKIIVTGSTSSLGKYLMPELAIDYDIVTMGRNSCDIYFDLLNGNNFIKMPEADILIHIAATFGGTSDEEILNIEKANAIGTLQLCIAAKQKVKQIVLISTQYVNLTPHSPYHSIYSMSKRHAEELTQLYCSINNIALTILRPAQIYDSKTEFKKSQPLLYLMADNAYKNKGIEIYGNNDALRNYIFVEDIVEIIKRTLKSEIIGVYSCNYPSDIKLSEIAAAATAAFKSNQETVFLHNKPNIPDNIFSNKSELYDKIGFYPQIDIKLGMKKLAEAYKSH